MTKEKKVSPSAFIPFCGFGEDISSMGVKIDQFDSHVCNSFQPKVMNDQLCYEVDLQKFAKKKSIDNDLKSGLSFTMDYNEDRQITFYRKESGMKQNWINRISEFNENNHAFIYLNTIGTPYI